MDETKEAVERDAASIGTAESPSRIPEILDCALAMLAAAGSIGLIAAAAV